MGLFGGPRSQPLAQRFAVARDFFRGLGIDARQLLQYLHETGSAILRCLGKICAAPKGRTVRVKKHGQRPAALLAHHRQGGHVNIIEIGALFTVQLDAHIMSVHQRRDLIVFKTLMRHDMAPVARGVADRQQHRHITPPRLVKNRLFPRLPVNRICHVLAQIRAGGRAQPVLVELVCHLRHFSEAGGACHLFSHSF